MAINRYDVIIIGAGAAGLMAAIECGKRGRKTLVLEKSKQPAEKIRISGGGRCNFTNLHTSASNFISQNPRFCISALKRYSQHDFIELVRKHKIQFHEKTLGQLFCDESSKQIIKMLLDECAEHHVELKLNVEISAVEKPENFIVTSDTGTFEAASLVIASGGKSIPKMGASGFGYQIAEQFGLDLIPTEPALVPLTFDGPMADRMKALAGVATTCVVSTNKTKFAEALLFTHRGLSGPAILQISSYWMTGSQITINLMPDALVLDRLTTAKQQTPKALVSSLFTGQLPGRLLNDILEETSVSGQLANVPDKGLRRLAERMNAWHLTPSGSEGYRTAEVTRGGVDTSELSSKTFEARKVPGLYFIGEVTDVTGHLGGFNFQWAWSSGHAAGQYA